MAILGVFGIFYAKTPQKGGKIMQRFLKNSVGKNTFFGNNL
jgi:hypothetical protein